MKYHSCLKRNYKIRGHVLHQNRYSQKEGLVKSVGAVISAREEETTEKPGAHKLDLNICPLI